MKIFGPCFAWILTVAAAATAQAASSDWYETPESSVRLVTAVSAVGTLDAIPAGIEFELKPEWKTYWRSPGDAGYPVSVDWQGSENLANATMRWPVPHRFTLFGLDTFGYAGRIVFPVTLVPERAGEAMRVTAQVRYLLCEEICIPYEANLALDLPAGTPAASPEAQLINQFESQVPGAGAEHGIEIARIDLSGGSNPTLSVTARSDIPFIAPDLLVEGSYDWRFPAPSLARTDGNREVTLTIVPEPLVGDAPPLDDVPLVLTLVDGTRGAEVAVPQGSVAAPPVGSMRGGILAMLLVALLGGLILNLMPCVLPVLSLKLLAAIGHGGGEARAVRRSFLATASGIVASFLLLAIVLAGLREAGATIGWGIQFQQPLFLIAMAAVVTLFAANLAGWFDVPLPQWIGNRAAGNGRPLAGNSLAGAFATGMLATLLATPCSAPFVGTAIGFALAGTTAETVAVFLAMGLGLALPYLLVAVRPRLATALPRPGRWMVWLRRLMALALLGTAIWLLTVVAANVGQTVALIAAALLGAILLLLWQRERMAPGLRRALPAFVAVLVAGAMLTGFWQSGRDMPESNAVADTIWQPFDEPAIATLVGEGRTVFVDVTADWCITCEVNKRLVLRRDAVAERLADPAVVAMQADWTRPDEAIARYLASFGRYGIPFNVVYGPDVPGGIVLPELLDRDDVLEALDRARGG